MSAFGPQPVLHMSAFRCKADMTLCGNPRSRSLLRAKRTSLFATHICAFGTALMRATFAKSQMDYCQMGFCCETDVASATENKRAAADGKLRPNEKALSLEKLYP
jgi:hypothetical protein